MPNFKHFWKDLEQHLKAERLLSFFSKGLYLDPDTMHSIVNMLREIEQTDPPSKIKAIVRLDMASITEAFKKDWRKNIVLKEYKQALSNSTLDPFTVYFVYNDFKETFNITSEELNLLTPDWILAKIKLLEETSV